MLPREKLFLRTVLVSAFVGLVCVRALTFQSDVYRQPGKARVVVPSEASRPCISAEDTPERLLEQAYSALRRKFHILEPLSSVQRGEGDLKAYQLFSAADGEVSIEVHHDGCRASVWICVPHHGLAPDTPNPAAYIWYQYVKDDATGNFVPVKSLFMDCTPFPDPDIPPAQLYHLTNTERWAHGGEYGGGLLNSIEDGLFPGTDPPHWSPILMGNDTPQRSDYVVLHELMQNVATQGEGISMLDAAAPPDRVDLTERVQHDYWTPVTLRGLLRNPHISSDDFARDHTFAYYQRGQDFPNGDLCTCSNHIRDWPGQDLDMRVIPDGDVHYLGSWPRRDENFELGVEIEQFAIQPPQGYEKLFSPPYFRNFLPRYRTLVDLYRRSLTMSPDDPSLSVFLGLTTQFDSYDYFPRNGEWAQIIGRWVIDCGHEKYTEIHPPELMVTTRLQHGRTEARVVATGAWAAESLTFAVFPPPRPTPNAVLRYRIRKLDGTDGFDRKDGGNLEILSEPSTNPNHLVGRLTSTSDEPLGLAETGMVGMTAQRGIKCVIDCWWESRLSSINCVAGMFDDTPALNSVIYYRYAQVANSRWSSGPIGSLSTTISNLPDGDYVFRPASPDWNFSDVPKQVTLRGGHGTLAFVAAPRALPATLRPWTGFPPGSDDIPSFINEDLTHELLTFNASPGVLAVQGNSLGYAERGRLLIHLQGLAKSETDSSPILRPTDAYEDSSRYFGGRLPIPGVPQYFAKGYPTSGVNNATIVVSLLVHSRGRTFVADSKEYRTSAGGVSVGFSAGSHAEEISLAIVVRDNPFNPWFLPIAETEHIKIYPGLTGGDASSLTLPSLDLVITPTYFAQSLSVATGGKSQGGAKPRSYRLSQHEADLIEEIEEKRSMSRFKLSRIIPPTASQKIPPVAFRTATPKNTKLPGKLENNWLLVKDPARAKTFLGEKVNSRVAVPSNGGVKNSIPPVRKESKAAEPLKNGSTNSDTSTKAPVRPAAPPVIGAPPKNPGAAEVGKATDLPDLIVTDFHSTGAAIFDPRTGTLQIPVTVVVQNQGRAAATLFKVAIEFAKKGSGEPSARADFTIPGFADLRSPMTRAPLAAGATITFTGRVVLPARLSGDPVLLQAVADYCTGEGLKETYCRVYESNERNNRSRQALFQLPRK
jgi:hypothetical protein